MKWLLIAIGASVGVIVAVDYFSNQLYTKESVLACVGVSVAFFVPWFRKIKKLE